MQRLLEGGAYFDLDFDLIIWGWCFFETRGLIEGKRYVQDIRPVIYVVLIILLLTLYKFHRLWNGTALIRGLVWGPGVNTGNTVFTSYPAGHWSRPGVFIVNFEQISHIVLVLALLTLNE